MYHFFLFKNAPSFFVISACCMAISSIHWPLMETLLPICKSMETQRFTDGYRWEFGLDCSETFFVVCHQKISLRSEAVLRKDL